MEFWKLRGIILKSINYREKDKLLYVATPENGKITIIAKNSIGKKSRTMSITQPLMLCDFMLIKGKNIHNMAEISPVHSFPKLRETFENITYASYFLELIDISMEDDLPNPRLFLELLKTLYVMETGVFELELLARAFEIKVLLRSGNQPSPIRNGEYIKDGPRNIIRFMLNNEMDKLLDLKYEEKDLIEVGQYNEELLKESFQRRPKSLDILKSDLY